MDTDLVNLSGMVFANNLAENEVLLDNCEALIYQSAFVNGTGRYIKATKGMLQVQSTSFQGGAKLSEDGKGVNSLDQDNLYLIGNTFSALRTSSSGGAVSIEATSLNHSA